MTSTGTLEAPPAEQLAGRLIEAAAGAMDLFAVYLGEQLGWYRSLAEDGPSTSGELAARTGTHERYAREWLEQQATTGILLTSPGEATERRYRLPAGYADVLVNGDSEMFAAPIGRLLTSSIRQAPKLLDAYRTGGGVAWEEFGEEMRTAQADFNRPFYLKTLVPNYISRIREVDEALTQPGARVAEIGPGGGWAAIAIARAYPQVRVDGFDVDAASVELASRNVEEAGLADRVSIHQQDGSSSDIAGEYDLVCAFECIHDMSNPVGVLSTMRRLARPGGTVLVMDERVGEKFGSIGDFNERLCYGFSLAVCLPDGMSHQPSAGTGTVMRRGTLQGYSREAGFTDAEILPLDHELFRFYRLHG